MKQFLHDERGCSSYLVASRSSREAAVIDPQWDIQPYLSLAADRDYRITQVIDTHLHADHVSGNRRLAEATGATLSLHADAEVDFAFHALGDGDEVPVGQVRLRVVHTPGHRPESMSLLVINPPRSPEPSMVLSGDTLFVGDVGRPDFGGPEGADQEWRSVHKLLELPDWVEVFPAHFEGSCGKGMCGRPSTTIGFERRYNPVLQLSHDDFLSYAAAPPARPLNMSAIMATNQGRADLTSSQDVPDTDPPRVEIADAAGYITERDAFVLDVREPGEYADGHVPGAVLLPQADLLMRLGEIPRDREVLVVCASGGRSRRAAQFLSGEGFDRVADLVGGTSGWIAAGLPVEVEHPEPAGSAP